jgi:hypothetical protein
MKPKTKAFIEGCQSGRFNTTKAQIYALIRQNAKTLSQLKIILNKPNKGDFSSRLNELKLMGLIYEINGGNETIYALTPEHLIEETAERYEKEAFYRWYKTGLNKKYFSKITVEN